MDMCGMPCTRLWLEAPHEGENGGRAWTTRRCHAHTQDTKATARWLLTLLARDHSSNGQITRTSRRHLWATLDSKTVDQPTLFVTPRPAALPCALDCCQRCRRRQAVDWVSRSRERMN